MLLFLMSGATGLVYEQVWTRELIFVFGGTTYAITTVLVCYMAGLGLGCYLGGRASHRVARPGWCYGVLEVAIGLYAIAVPLLLSLMEPLYRAVYPHAAGSEHWLTAARFLLSAGVLLIPTTAMGATLPLLVHQFAADGTRTGRNVGRLYGINTLGAVLGTVAAGFWMIPALGLTAATRAAALVNVAVGLAAMVLFHRVRASEPGTLEPTPGAGARLASLPSASGSDGARQTRAVLVVFALSGFASMVYQVTWTRALVMCLGSTTYSFTCILAAFILGLALGSLALAPFVDRWKRHAAALGVVQLAIALSAVGVLPLYSRVPAAVHAIVFGAESYGRVLAVEFALVIALTLVPTLLMGATFPLVTRAIAANDRSAAAATGRAYAVNTIGTILGSFLAGFVLIRVVGGQNAIVLAAMCNAGAGAWLLLRVDPRASRPAPYIPLAALAMVPLIAFAAGGWDRQALTSAPFLKKDQPLDAQLVHEVVYYRDGVDMSVAVSLWPGERPDVPGVSLSVNGKADASTLHTDMVTQLMLGHVGALFDEGGRRACVVGLGSGMTLAAIARYPGYEQIDCAELSEEVIYAAREYFGRYNWGVVDDPRVRMIRADGRNHLLLTDRTYDLIVSEPSNPWIAGVSNLFTREYFELVKRRLAPDGWFCVWLHGYCMSQRDFRAIVNTMFTQFDSISVWELSAEADYLFLMSPTPRAAPADVLMRRFAEPRVREDLYRVAFSRLDQVLARFITADAPLRDWAAGAPLNTDDNALLEFSAPRNMFRSEQFEIADALYELRVSPFDGWIAADPAREAHAALIGRCADTIRAREMRVEAMRPENRSDAVRCLQLLIDAYELDPGGYDVYRTLTELRGEFTLAGVMPPEGVSADRLTGRAAALADLSARIDALRRPVLGDVTGTPIEGMVNSLLSFSQQAVQRQQQQVAVAYLREALVLAPRRADVVVALAEALAAASQRDEALAVLKSWLAAATHNDVEPVHTQSVTALLERLSGEAGGIDAG